VSGSRALVYGKGSRGIVCCIGMKERTLQVPNQEEEVQGLVEVALVA